MPRIIVVYYSWRNTSDNHAGMSYFVRCLKRDVGHPVRLIRVPDNYGGYRSRLCQLWRYLVSRLILVGLRPDDGLFFTEYLSPRQSGEHYKIVSDLRRYGVTNRIIGLVHLPPQKLLQMYGERHIRSAIDLVDNIIVMGSSLTSFFDQLGCRQKVKQTFYYVDTDYYSPRRQNLGRNQFRVLIAGSLYRNREMLKFIIERSSQITFDLCAGGDSLQPMFAGLPNVLLHQFIPESELLIKMQNADASLSVFDDTVGSNVVVTSLACGLPLVVSNVGSIRDYCDEDNTIFCSAPDDFVVALEFLKGNSDLRSRMSTNARRRAEELSLPLSIAWYKQFFESH